jgi:protein-S-isoprenylcysteine O-methyltransferase Ste14
MVILLSVSGVAWLVLEVSLRVRDRSRGQGSTGQDRGTRALNSALVVVAVVVADVLSAVIGKHSPLWIPGAGADGWPITAGLGWPIVAGLVIIWLGLALRIWAIVVLGRSFRTTVEVDAGQAVVSRGPYRWVRHPSYTGLLLIAAGFGLAFSNWPGLVICLVVPAAATLRRIQVEESELTRVLGDPYLAYRDRTKRLIPGVW